MKTIFFAALNFFLWMIASSLVGMFLSPAVGILYFLIGYPLSLVAWFFSEFFEVPLLDKITGTGASIFYRKLVWSNGVSTGIIWGMFILIGLIG